VKRILYLLKKEFIQIRRDRAMRALLFIAPIIQLLVLGSVVSSEVKNIYTVVCDLDQSPISRQIIERIANSKYFNVKYFDNRESHLHYYLDSDKASMVVVIPQDLSRNLAKSMPTQIQVLVDGQDSNTSTIALGYLNGVLESFISDRMTQQLASMPDLVGVHLLTLNIRIWYNENLKNSDYMVPGIAVFLLTMITSLICAMGLVREREIGTLEQLLVTPLKKHELIIGKIIPFALIGLFELGLAIGFAKLWYHIPIRGNIGLFFLFSLIYLFTTLGIGLFVSASSHTQQQAMFMSWFFLLFMLLLSGFMFPIDNMPKSAQYLTYLNPLRYFIVVTREILIKSASLKHLYWQGVALIIFGGTIFSFSVLRFQSRMK
jgi:ABC-2 type transport system permease protein